MPKFVALLFALIAFGQPTIAEAGTSTPGAPAAAFVMTVTSDIVALLNGNDPPTDDRGAQLRRLLESSVDLKGVGQFVLDQHWQGATEDQREEYLSLFSDYVLAKLIRALWADPVRDISVVDWASLAGGDATVRTLVVRGRAPNLDWTWKLRGTGQGYRAVDLISDGVSMAKTLQAEFGSYVDANGLEALLQVLRTR